MGTLKVIAIKLSGDLMRNPVEKMQAGMARQSGKQVLVRICCSRPSSLNCTVVRLPQDESGLANANDSGLAEGMLAMYCSCRHCTSES